MGIVWRARQTSLNRIVALKTIRAEALDSPAARQRFRAEAETAATLSHAHIVPIFEVGETMGRAWFAMQLIEGGTLAHHLADGSWSARHCRAHREPRLPWLCRLRCCPRGAALLTKLARAVHHAHQHGVLHGDLKPGNILLDEEGEPHVTDFGLARWLDRAGGRDEAGEVAGTPSYMAPEQVGGESSITIASDIYSLGAIFYHILTGQPPCLADTLVATLRKAREGLPAPLRALNPEVDRDLEAICRKCLARAPEDRYASAASLADDLDRWHRAEDIRARRASPWERLCRWARRRPAVAGLSALTLLLLLAGVTGTVWQARRANRHQAIAERSLEQLWQATPALAHAHRASPQAGWRSRTLDAIATAARVRPSTALRNEAIAALAQADLVPSVPERPVPPGGHQAHFSPDLELVALPLLDPPRWRVARLADDATVAEFPVSNLAGEGPVFSPSCRFLAFRSAGRGPSGAELLVWDLVRKEVRLRIPAAQAGGFAWSPDETTLAFIAPARGLQLASLAQVGRTRELLPDARGGSVRFGPDGRLAVMQGSRLRILDPANGRVTDEHHFDTAVVACTWSPDGRWLALGGENAEVRLWSPGSAETRLVGTHDGLVHHVEFGPGGDLLLSSGYDGSSRFWELPSGRPILFTQQGYAQQFSRDGRRIGWFRTRHSYGVWECSLSPIYRTFRLPGGGADPIQSAELESNGRWLLLAGGEAVHCLSTTNGTAAIRQPLAGVRAARWWPGRREVLAATASGLVRLSVEEAGPAHPPRFGPPEPLEFPGLAGLVDVWCSADGNRALAVSGQEAWLITFGATSTARRLPGGLPTRGRHARLSPDGRWAAASADYSGGTWIWDATGANERRSFQPAILSRAAFSPDGHWVATACFDAVILHDTDTWQAGLRLPRDSASDLPGLAAFSPDGRMLAFTPHLRRIRLVEPVTGRELATPTAPDLRMLTDLFFSGDGRFLGGLTSDHVVQLWDLAELRRQMVPLGLDWKAP